MILQKVYIFMKEMGMQKRKTDTLYNKHDYAVQRTPSKTGPFSSIIGWRLCPLETGPCPLESVYNSPILKKVHLHTNGIYHTVTIRDLLWVLLIK